VAVRAANRADSMPVVGPVRVYPKERILELVVLTVVNQDVVLVVMYVVVPSNQISELMVVVYAIGLICSVSVQMFVIV
jgi:hypothetical protein